jgi:predicted nucleic acid-binding protein
VSDGVVLDANILIALLQPDHAHHDTVVTFLSGLDADAAGNIAQVHRLTLAEVLVGYPSEAERLAIYHHLVGDVGLHVWDLRADEEVTLLATARQRTGIKMPDACVLAVAMWPTGNVLTFDKRLMGAAAKIGVGTISLT